MINEFIDFNRFFCFFLIFFFLFFVIFKIHKALILLDTICIHFPFLFILFYLKVKLKTFYGISSVIVLLNWFNSIRFFLFSFIHFIWISIDEQEKNFRFFYTKYKIVYLFACLCYKMCECFFLCGKREWMNERKKRGKCESVEMIKMSWKMSAQLSSKQAGKNGLRCGIQQISISNLNVWPDKQKCCKLNESHEFTRNSGLCTANERERERKNGSEKKLISRRERGNKDEVGK